MEDTPQSPSEVLSWADGDPTVLVSAPHGNDYHTYEIAHEVCKILGCRGMALPAVDDPETGLRCNINRPTMGAGLTVDEEVPSELAERVYRMYLKLVLALAGRHGPELYVEIHANETQQHVEVATVRISDEARALVKEVLEGIPSGALVEGIDDITLDADQSRQVGLLRFIPRALHFELTEEARAPENRSTTVQFIAQAIMAALSVGA